VAKSGSVYIVANSCQALRNSSIKAFSMHFPDISAAYGITVYKTKINNKKKKNKSLKNILK